MSDPVMKELLHNIAASKAITTAAIEQGVLIGRREGMAKLDQAWAIFMARREIEKLGGMDPLKRGKE